MKGFIVSDFNAEGFVRLLENDESTPTVEIETTPYDQVIPTLLQRKSQTGFAIVWTLPQKAIASFERMLSYETVSVDMILGEVEAFARSIQTFATGGGTVFVPTWVLPTQYRGLGSLLEMKPGVGVAHTLAQMNLKLAEVLSATNNVFVLNTQKWIETSGNASFNPKLWYMGKIAFGNEVFKEALKDIKAALRSRLGLAKKLLLIDLDNTLWGGIVGDQGWQNLKLGGHDPAGEAYVDFQKTLKSFKNRGILLGLVSKNEESLALEAIEKNPEMILKREDFVGWRINWQDKAQNIASLVAELNLGLQSVVFLDDHPVERERIRSALPEVTVPEMPSDPALYKSFLLSLRDFDAASITDEDQNRSQMMVAERERQETKQKLESLSDTASIERWIESLQIKVVIEKLNPTNLTRATQLFNKTNQMNLSTRRLTDTELMAWANQTTNKLFTFRVSDKFGDSGLTGIVGISISGAKAELTDFILSCRVMGRQVEQAMLHTAILQAQLAGAKQITATYLPTAKNKPTLEFLKASGLEMQKPDLAFAWTQAHPYPKPKCLTLTEN